MNDAKDYAVLADLREMLGVGAKPMLSDLDVLVRDEIQSLRSQLASPQPVKVEDMPALWKDGRYIGMWVKGCPVTADFRKMHKHTEGDFWISGYGWYEDHKGKNDLVFLLPDFPTETGGHHEPTK